MISPPKKNTKSKKERRLSKKITCFCGAEDTEVCSSTKTMVVPMVCSAKLALRKLQIGKFLGITISPCTP